MIRPTATGVSGWPNAACRASTAARPAWRRASRCAWAPGLPHAGIGVPAMPGAPRRCAATPTWSTSGRSSPACATARPPRWPRRSGQGRAAVRGHQRLRRGLWRLQPVPERHGRYWTLHYLQQHGMTELTATVIKDGLVRADELPLVLAVLGAEGCRAAPRCACAWARSTTSRSRSAAP